MRIKFYNTKNKQKDFFYPITAGHITMYVCGPTVYDRAHIGNARSAVVFDTLYRFLSLQNKVTYVRNITDIDDKIIDASFIKNKTIAEITNETTKLYHEDMEQLGVALPTIEPKATDHIDEMIDMIKQLLAQQNAYEIKGHILFDTASYSNYGILSNRNLDDMIAGARVEIAPYKKNPQDFVLWKPSAVNTPGWNSPWGRGRPGWHIECSAMTLKHLGKNFDIHGGGQDLIFPHHENECAQSICANNSSFANYWLHNGMLMIDGKKMSKSSGNVFTVNELLKQSHGEEIRLAIISTHYRQPLNWTENTLVMAKSALQNLYKSLEGETAKSDDIDQSFMQALCDDLNTPKAICRLHEMANQIKKTYNNAEKSILRALLKNSGKILGILQNDYLNKENSTANKEQIDKLINQRLQAKQEKNYKLADQIRTQLKNQGILLEDTGNTTKWRKEI